MNFYGTMNGDVLTIAKDTPSNSITFWNVSNNPTNCPTDCKWGSYLMINAGGIVTILYADNNHMASAYNITSSSASITWHIM